jgi:hypothetical protein
MPFAVLLKMWEPAAFLCVLVSEFCVSRPFFIAVVQEDDHLFSQSLRRIPCAVSVSIRAADAFSSQEVPQSRNKRMWNRE